MRYLASILTAIVVFVSGAPASPFSPFNKYRLDFSTIDSTTRAVCDTPYSYMGTSAQTFAAEKLSPTVSLTHGDAGCAISFFSLGTLDGRLSSYSAGKGNEYIGARVSFTQGKISAVVKADVHTIYRFDKSSFADSFTETGREQFYTGAAHIDGAPSMDFNFSEGYLRYTGENLSLTSGKFKLRWGPGYTGTLALSGTTVSPYYLYYLQSGLGKTLTAEAFLSALDDDHLYVDNKLHTEGGVPRYSAGQRLVVNLGDRVSLGVYEIVNFYGVNLLSRYANPIQVYYFSNIAGGSGESKSNIMGGGDVVVKCGSNRMYAQFLNDDITIFDKNGSPNKWGAQLGFYHYSNGFIKEWGAEYTHVTWGVYTHYAPGLSRHEYWHEARGFPYGNDVELWNAHAVMAPRADIRLRGEVSWWIKGEGTMGLYHWDAIQSNTPDTTLIEGTPPQVHVLGHGDNEGDFMNYSQDRQMISLLIECEWRPFPWLALNSALRPALVKGKLSSQAHVSVLISSPFSQVYSVK